MHLKSILNRVERHKCFVYKQVRFVDGLVEPEFEVEIEPRANSRAICLGCGEKRPGYDRLSPRRFQFVPLWNIAVFFVYAMWRVDCPTCGVTVERVPWGEGKEHLTTSYRWFLARWAKRLSWKETADAFSTTWDNVFRSVKHAVAWGLAHRDLSGIEAIGVDEIQWRSGHTYLTLVYQIDGAKRLLWVAQDRTEQSLRGFFTSLTAEVRAGIRFVCSDMWRQYLNVIAEQIPAALHVLDRFHIMRNMNMALDEVRRAEVAQLRRDGYEPILTKARWCLLKRPENLTEHEGVRLKEILQYNLKTSRASGLICSARTSSGSGSTRAPMGQEVPRCRVHPLLAQPHRPDEEDGPEPAASSASDPQLVAGSRHHLVGRCRGIQRQSKTDHQKSVRLQDAAGHRNRPLSCARPPTGARVRPQIPLRRF